MNSENQPVDPPDKRWQDLARKLMIITALFASVLSILMIANYIQTKTIEPLKSPALSQLMLQLQKEPENQALKEQIRALDLLARRAYFTNQWQVRTGGFLLFACIDYFNRISGKYWSNGMNNIKIPFKNFILKITVYIIIKRSIDWVCKCMF